jgi:hypothetical protein
MDLAEMDLMETDPVEIDSVDMVLVAIDPMKTMTQSMDDTSLPMNPAIRNDMRGPPPSARR